MNYKSIQKRQKESGFYEMQRLINNGSVWLMEGSMGREAMRLLECGACMLPTKAFRDAYGNRIPSRYELRAGSKGTYANCIEYYQNNEAILYL
jgi:hypothetical protein